MPKKIRHIYDRFTKTLLSNKEMAVAFIEAYLPTEINEIIETQSLEYIDTSYITEDMRNVFSDLVVNVTLKNSTKIKLCFLFEHKSYIDEETPFQILEYLALAYKNQRKEKKKFELRVCQEIRFTELAMLFWPFSRQKTFELQAIEKFFNKEK